MKSLGLALMLSACGLAGCSQTSADNAPSTSRDAGVADADADSLADVGADSSAEDGGCVLHGEGGAPCGRDSDCPPGERCGFTSCAPMGVCIKPEATCSGGPGGQCGCDGQPVDLICAVGVCDPFASAPAIFLGPCPRPCTDGGELCPPSLVCVHNICRLATDGG